MTKPVAHPRKVGGPFGGLRHQVRQFAENGSAFGSITLKGEFMLIKRYVRELFPPGRARAVATTDGIVVTKDRFATVRRQRKTAPPQLPATAQAMMEWFACRPTVALYIAAVYEAGDVGIAKVDAAAAVGVTFRGLDAIVHAAKAVLEPEALPRKINGPHRLSKACRADCERALADAARRLGSPPEAVAAERRTG
jgi:hypothetical protein